MITEGLCKCGHSGSDHVEYGASHPCNVRYVDSDTGLTLEYCMCYNFVNVNLESALGAKNLGEV